MAFKRREEEKKEISRKLCASNQINEELTGQLKSLQSEQASLQSENAQLEGEIQKLSLKPGMLPELHQEHVKQLLRKSIEEETHGLEMEKKCPKVRGRLDYICQKCSLYKKMEED